MSRPVLSADDVRAARRRGETRLEVPEGALVTPLARDEAQRLGVELVQAGVGAGSATPPPVRPHTATCDPDDLERVIERVRAQVPGADPVQVREIARRILEQGGA
ncbi:MAG TPA: hypothetical protein VJP59_01955 [Gemmatimonadota bacterium]|nr:hypothetical protein [Gemmatimonadota bacterium]